MSGYQAAISDRVDVVVKIDGDGQMAPELLPKFVAPIAVHDADYTKGNRFYDLANINRMPAVRILGNAVLSFLSKLSTGYWDIFDPTNGYTAIHARVLKSLPLDRISPGYFFETDMLFRMNTVRAVVVDVPMDAVYEGGSSNLRISRILGEFMTILGGSLFQVLLPFGIGVAFYVRQRDPFGAAMCLWWTGASLVDLSPYIYDALYPKLTLLGGHTGESGGPHDWIYILEKFGMIKRAQGFGIFTHHLGVLVMFGSVAWGARWLWKMAPWRREARQ